MVLDRRIWAHLKGVALTLAGHSVLGVDDCDHWISLRVSDLGDDDEEEEEEAEDDDDEDDEQHKDKREDKHKHEHVHEHDENKQFHCSLCHHHSSCNSAVGPTAESVARFGGTRKRVPSQRGFKGW